ncbi:N-acetyltransferase [Pseudooceanicola sediminis]|uniref:N-acetyltransferase n=1 Tax=Pseudooceanicola sediminis TaxID=2211117 RepID=A0A399IY62_9RHOB|nr:N-acetyltransferase [Pseudooceanicola sediminis]KAA2312335.1 N-acetyltransferase [Puniceibacterium sp. HSS470]RII37387.1 N-acetyltransferase [Pseudooceanicola sediminis]|tara:strand:- start:4581 stop:5084 length:504 start_codon:yes stop_codon:yes gene_type:complete
MARKSEITLRLFQPGDEIAVGNVLTQAYDTPAEARLVQSLRDCGAMEVELLAYDDEKTVGYIGFSRHEAPRNWFSLMPLAVLPYRRNIGVGADLIRYGLDYVRRAGADAVTVVGDGRYYQRFGFTYRAAQNLTTPYSIERTLLYPIAPGSAFSDATLVYPEAFATVD